MHIPYLIAVVDDSPLYRFTLQKIIDGMENYETIIEATNGKDFLDQLSVRNQLPDICILDIGMPIMNGYDTMSLLKTLYPTIKILIFSAYNSEYTIKKMLSLGVNGFISKNEEPEFVISAIQEICNIGYFYSKYANKENFKENECYKGDLPDLTPMEIKLLSLCATELLYKDMAEQLSISKNTVEKHIQNMFKKTGLNSRVALVLFAIYNELI